LGLFEKLFIISGNDTPRRCLTCSKIINPVAEYSPFPNEKSMKTNYALVLIIGLLFLFTSCGRKIGEHDGSAQIAAEVAFAPQSEKTSGPQYEGMVNPKLIKKGELTINATNLDSVKSTICRFVSACNGYVKSENYSNYYGSPSYELSVNIQATHFDDFLKMLDSSGIDIISRTFSVEDVTLKYVDDSTRLANKKKLEKKYLELLSKANDIKSILEIEDKMEEIQTDIEIMDSQLKMLDKQITYSEFTIKIEKKYTNLSYEKSNKFLYKLGQGIVSGWTSAKTIVIFLFSIWPVYVLIFIAFIILRKVIRRRKSGKSKQG
jgi:hypothetical protein